MKVSFPESPRVFQAGAVPESRIRDMGRIELAPGEQVTFTSPSGSEYDVVRMEWGYYATPSLNHRLLQKGFRSALVRNEAGRLYILLVEQSQLGPFQAWLEREKHEVLTWLDGATAASPSSPAAP